MFFKKKNKKRERCFWIKKTGFIEEAISVLQREVDCYGEDLQLIYEQSFSLPDKYWEIRLNYDGGNSAEEVEKHSRELMKALRNRKAIERAGGALIQEKRKVVGISYMIYENDDGEHVVILYWERR